MLLTSLPTEVSPPLYLSATPARILSRSDPQMFTRVSATFKDLAIQTLFTATGMARNGAKWPRKMLDIEKLQRKLRGEALRQDNRMIMVSV